eukprot:CAMPEP_0170948710 /NCGR_PEP_ID=MMETSP0735-20130129/28816_1 /TAXON_ID=186038 /ORGANISM="Fragilariopsis kerguelensis, Strain L26-C5" /LENGTH=168 /DNA_ID=CAMNT_0011358583 /DNA_START=62 /DNA_END=568 /DNA_ORIENTATION=+
MMMFTRPAVRAVTTANTVPMLRSGGKQSSLSPRAAVCNFSSLVERSSIDSGHNMSFLTMNQSSRHGGDTTIATNVNISNNNNVVVFNNNIFGSSFSSSSASLSVVRNTTTTMHAVNSSIDNLEQVNTLIQTLNRNARRGKKANHGSRPCSRVGRRKRKEAIGSRKRTR